MKVRCLWEVAPEFGACTVSGCPKEARLVCHEHPEESNYCSRHRSIHTRSIAKRNAELDSRPREPARARRLVQNLQYLPGALSKEMMSEAARLV